jgi:hypothetical protein
MANFGSNKMDFSSLSPNSFGYQDLIGTKDKPGMGDKISSANKQVEDLMATLDATKTGSPVELLKLQALMNNLSQVLTMTTQMMNSLKQAIDKINQNI